MDIRIVNSIFRKPKSFATRQATKENFVQNRSTASRKASAFPLPWEQLKCDLMSFSSSTAKERRRLPPLPQMLSDLCIFSMGNRLGKSRKKSPL
jgi:hypothetical protein